MNLHKETEQLNLTLPGRKTDPETMNGPDANEPQSLDTDRSSVYHDHMYVQSVDRPGGESAEVGA